MTTGDGAQFRPEEIIANRPACLCGIASIVGIARRPEIQTADGLIEVVVWREEREVGRSTARVTTTVGESRRVFGFAEAAYSRARWGATAVRRTIRWTPTPDIVASRKGTAPTSVTTNPRLRRNSEAAATSGASATAAPRRKIGGFVP